MRRFRFHLVVAVLLASGVHMAEEVSAVEGIAQVLQKIEIVGAVLRKVVSESSEGFRSMRQTICVAGWDGRAERYRTWRTWGSSGKGQYLVAATGGQLGESACGEIEISSRGQALRSGVTWIALAPRRDGRCGGDYCVGVASDASAWDYGVKCSPMRCEVVSRTFIAME